MKRLSKVCGVILLLSGLVLYFLCDELKESMQPNQVSVGVMIGDTFHETDKGTLGGNREGVKTMESLQSLGIMADIGGVVLLVISATMKGENYGDFN